MSKIFWDNLLSLEDIEKEIKNVAETSEEKEELWGIVDEIIHHKVMGCILDKLPPRYHEEFLGKFHEAPYDETLLDYLKEKIGKNFKELLKQELGGLIYEILEEIKLNPGNK